MIKIQSQVKWPVLEDSDTDPKEFYREVEHVCQMCNDGHGMVPKEKLTVLLQSLRGHRKKIYNYVLKENFELSKTDAGAEEVYQLIKDRMSEFTETLTEKQTRVQSEFRFLEKREPYSTTMGSSVRERAFRSRRRGTASSAQRKILGIH